METTDHILFQCPIASFLWTFFRGMLGWSRLPSSMEALFVEVIYNLHGKLRSLTLLICAGALWTLWKTRNDIVFNGKACSNQKLMTWQRRSWISCIKAWWRCEDLLASASGVGVFLYLVVISLFLSSVWLVGPLQVVESNVERSCFPRFRHLGLPFCFCFIVN